jgi:O-antigen/teichoic acid export membrane protein
MVFPRQIYIREDRSPILNFTSRIQFFKGQCRKFPAKLKNSAFVKNVFIVMSGTALAQVLGFALSPIISRLYSPADFGVFGSFTAILGVVAAGITLDYSQALMLPKRKEDAFGLFVISCLSGFLIAAFCLGLCLIAPGFVIHFMKAPNAWILVLLLIGILGTDLNQAFQSWCIRGKAFKHTSASQVVRSLSVNGTQIGLGFLKGGASALIFAVTLGDMLATLSLAKVVLREIMVLWRTINWRRLRQLAKEYRDFPLYSASANVINSLSVGLPVFLLAHYYGIAMAGAYAFGIRLMQAPMELILRALRQVLYQKASETHNEGRRLVPLYWKITGGLFAVGFFPSLILFIGAPQIFSWIFGVQWHIAGEFARSLMLWLLFAFCNMPAVLFTRIVRLQRRKFFFEQASLVGRALALILGGMYLPASQTVFLFSLVGAVMNIVFIIIIGFALMKMEGGTALKDILRIG